jgi:hypothetical protein
LRAENERIEEETVEMHVLKYSESKWWEQVKNQRRTMKLVKNEMFTWIILSIYLNLVVNYSKCFIKLFFGCKHHSISSKMKKKTKPAVLGSPLAPHGPNKAASCADAPTVLFRVCAIGSFVEDVLRACLTAPVKGPNPQKPSLMGCR